MVPLLTVANIVLLTLLLAAVCLLNKYSRKLHGRRLFLSRLNKIPCVPLDEVDPAFQTGAFGATTDAEVHFIGGPVFAGPDPNETWILAALARGARRMFEFGTCTGRTTYLWARNSPRHARVATLTLDSSGLDAYAADAGDSARDTRIALRESCCDRFFYSDTSVECKVEQLFGDSKRFDETRYVDACDLVFVDGSHAYSYVASDSQKALRMVRPGGLVLWHDYRDGGRPAGVVRFLNELVRQLPLRRIAGTALVCYRRPQEIAERIPFARAA